MRANSACDGACPRWPVPFVLVFLLAVATTGAQVPAGAPDDVGLSAKRLDRIGEMIQRAIDAKQISGAVTVVARRGHVAHFKARGLMNVEANALMRKDAIFPIASMTKPVTGGVASAATSRIAPRDETGTVADWAAALGAAPLDFQPGTRWRYSGLAGIDTLGRIVEVASGLTFDEFLRQRIFEPLGMKDAAFNVPEDKKSRVVVLDGVAARGDHRSTGSFGWLGAFGTAWWVDPGEDLTAILMVQTPGGPLRADFQNAVIQAIVD